MRTRLVVVSVLVAAGFVAGASPVSAARVAGSDPHIQRIASFLRVPEQRRSVARDGRRDRRRDGGRPDARLYGQPERRDRLVDIADPANPQPGGTLAADGEPTSVAVAGPWALVAVNTSASFTDPSGHLAVVNMASPAIVTTIPLAGQPDSVKVSPNRRFAAVVIENERDEEVVVDDVEGGLPQAPPGLLQIVHLIGGPAAWTVHDVDLTGLADYAGDDPEPEFVDINARNWAVVTLQENNHIAIVDLRRGRVVDDFSAGTVDLVGVDTVEDGSST